MPNTLYASCRVVYVVASGAASGNVGIGNVSIEWLDAQSKKRKKSLHTNDVDWGAFLIEIALEQLVSTDILKKL